MTPGALQPTSRFATVGCLHVAVWAWRAPEFGTGFEAQMWLLPPQPAPLFPLAGRRTSSNPSLKLPCVLARGLNSNQSAVTAALFPRSRQPEFAPGRLGVEGSVARGQGDWSVKLMRLVANPGYLYNLTVSGGWGAVRVLMP